MLILNTFVGAFGEPSASPFCVKAMCLLEMSGLPWKPDFRADLRKAPMGKFPVLLDGDRVIADSSAIQTYLEDRHGIDFDATLSPKQKAQAHLLRRTVEEHLYFAIVHDRWARDDNWDVIRELYFAPVPRPLRGLIAGRVRAQVMRNLHGQGMARHGFKGACDRVAGDLEAVLGVLDGKAFLFGDAPGSADVSVAPMLAAMAGAPNPTPLRSMIRENSDLMSYVERVRASVYPGERAALAA